MSIDPNAFNHITRPILAAAIEVHRVLGPGLLESTYIPCLHFELTARKLRFVTQHSMPIVYKGMALDAVYRLDLIVEDLIVVEVKSVATLAPVHQAQLLTYLALANCPIGLLINFNVPRLMDGVKRLINPRARTRTEGTEGTGNTEERRANGDQPNNNANVIRIRREPDEADPWKRAASIAARLVSADRLHLSAPLRRPSNPSVRPPFLRSSVSTVPSVPLRSLQAVRTRRSSSHQARSSSPA
jgi:GxxExxY protein